MPSDTATSTGSCLIAQLASLSLYPRDRRALSTSLPLLDVDMPRLNGLETLKLIKEHNPGTVVIMMTAFANIDDAVRAVKDRKSVV